MMAVLYGVALGLLCEQLVDKLLCGTCASAALLEGKLFCLCIQVLCGDVQSVLFCQSVDDFQIEVLLCF